MLLVININKPTYEYPKHVIDKKYMQNINFFNVQWYFKYKNLQQSHHLKL
jgi:hypothetical protein